VEISLGLNRFSGNVVAVSVGPSPLMQVRQQPQQSAFSRFFGDALQGGSGGTRFDRKGDPQGTHRMRVTFSGQSALAERPSRTLRIRCGSLGALGPLPCRASALYLEHCHSPASKGLSCEAPGSQLLIYVKTYLDATFDISQNCPLTSET